MIDTAIYDRIKDVRANSVQRTGIGVQYPGGLRFVLAFAGGANEKFGVVMLEEMAPYRTAIAAEALTDATAGRILSRTYVRSVILEWESDDADNQPPPLSNVEAAAKWLRKDDVLFGDIEGIVIDPKNFRSPDGDVQAADREASPAG